MSFFDILQLLVVVAIRTLSLGICILLSSGICNPRVTNKRIFNPHGSQNRSYSPCGLQMHWDKDTCGENSSLEFKT